MAQPHSGISNSEPSEPGEYEDAINITTSGTANQPITLSAWKDDSVRIGSVLRDVPAADKWKPVEKTKSWSVQLQPGQPKDLIVVLDGKPIVTEFKDAPPPGRRCQLGDLPRKGQHAYVKHR